MKKWATEFKAICAKTGELRTYCGPHVEAPSWGMAQEWCYENAGHLWVIGELIAEIPFLDEGGPGIDYEISQLN